MVINKISPGIRVYTKGSRPVIRTLLCAGITALLCGSTIIVHAGTLAHYAPGMMNIRDFFQPPEAGFYVVAYNFFYDTDTLKDRDGNEVGSLSNGTTTLTIEPDVEVYALAPAFLWASTREIFGARYAALITPTFADNSVAATLSLAHSGEFINAGITRTLSADTGFGVGDMFVQPLWLDWSGKHYDITTSYGFYAPIGEDGIGLDFWEHQFQVAGAWYPFDHHGTAVTVAGTYELNHEKMNKDLSPGDRFTFNWGVSQYLPLNKEQTLLVELGVSGYSHWQIEQDTGADVPRILNTTLNAKDEVHAIGIQTGLASVPMKAALTARYQWEYGAEGRFEGQNFILTLVKGF